MEAYEIRLRGGWECRPWNDPSAASVRLALPTRWGDFPRERLRLSRRFQRPPQGPEEPAALVVRNSPGIRSITLNGAILGTLPPGTDSFEVPLGRLERGNELVLDVTPPADPAEWGFISLVFMSPSFPPTATADRLSPGENQPVSLE